ncbi:MAG: recombination protein RecR [Micrococcales bacterium]|nr:recombination protein RecR [Micrococcales bacterium]
MYEGIVQDLIDELAKLPGVGPKGASRIAFYLLHADHGEIERLAQVLSEVRDKARFCAECFNVSEDDVCRICSDTRRDQSKLCVVEDPKDVLAIERTREFRGLYHVLGGAINPMDGIGPDSLNIAQLIARLADNSIQEVILATNQIHVGSGTVVLFG